MAILALRSEIIWMGCDNMQADDRHMFMERCNRREFNAALTGVVAAVPTIGRAKGMLPTSAPVHALLDGYVRKREVPGLVALMSQGDRVRVHVAGVQDVGTAVPMQRDTIFSVASITKPIIAAAAMMLVEKGHVELDAPVDRWLPEIANRHVVRDLYGPIDDTLPAVRPITLRDLLTLKLGLGMVFADAQKSPLLTRFAELELSPSEKAFPHSADEFMQRLGSLPLAYQPGAHWLYHTGIDVAAILIGRVTGSLPDFVAECIFLPLGMKDSGFHVPKQQLHRLATVYTHDHAGGRFVADKSFDVSHPPAMPSEIASTADDFNAFGRMLLGQGLYRGKRVLSPASVGEMTRDQLPAPVKDASYFYPGFWKTHGWGLGMSVVTAPDEISAVPGRYGWWGGTGTMFFAEPACDTVAVLMTNRIMRGPEDTAIGNAFLKWALRQEPL